MKHAIMFLLGCSWLSFLIKASESGSQIMEIGTWAFLIAIFAIFILPSIRR